ncbi:hypothetical protein EON65_15990 [archaeon]|nr:MAG: hypothetical protein EON65_15990 [archaeon]
MSAFATVDTAAINANGVKGFESSGLLETLKTNMTSTNATTASEALEMVKTLCENVDQWIEPYVVTTLPLILDNLALPKTAAAAADAGNAILHKSNAHSVRVIVSLLFESLASMKWQTKKVDLHIAATLSSRVFHSFLSST